MRLLLHVPAWHHVTEGDKGARNLPVHLNSLPREGDQICVPGQGIVTVVMVRHRPAWNDNECQSSQLRAGGLVEYTEQSPEVFTEWARRPDGAPQKRSRTD